MGSPSSEPAPEAFWGDGKIGGTSVWGFERGKSGLLRGVERGCLFDGRLRQN